MDKNNIITPNVSKSELTTGNVLFAIWICVGIFMAVYYVTGYLRMKQKIRRWSNKCADSQVEDMLKEICTEIKLKISSIIHIKNGGKTYAVKKVPVDYGIEVRTDISGDAKTDRVWVVDTVSGDYEFTQVCAALNDGSDFFIDYPDSWASSYLITGDLNGNGAADVVVLRYDMGSTYGGCAVSVLHMGKNDLREDDFEEYPSVFIQNLEFGTEQPVGFGEEDWFSCIGASIIEKNGKTMLRLVACVDAMNDIAQCIDCSYQVDGWYIEDIQLVSDYWGSDKESELLGYSY